MKSTYAIAMLALLLLGIGGSVLGYNTAVHKMNAHEAHNEETHAEVTHAEQAHADADITETAAEPVSAEEAVPADEGEGESGVGEAAATGAAAEAATAGDADHGQSLYTAQCAGCHGANAGGGLGPALNDAAKWSDSEFHSALRTGQSPHGQLKAPMPQFGESQLSDSDITDIHAFIQTL